MTADEMDEMLHADTPEATGIWESIARGGQLYSTPLFSLRQTAAGDLLELAGSGTYLRKGERYFILTAAHVWHEMLKDSNFVGVTLREVDDHRCLIQMRSRPTVPFDLQFGMTWDPTLLLSKSRPIELERSRPSEASTKWTADSKQW